MAMFQLSRKSNSPALKPNPSRISKAFASAIDVPVSTACTTYSGQATNMKANSMGSVTPVRNAVSATDAISPPTAFLALGLASW